MDKIQRLYSKQRTQKDVYTYKINNYGISEPELCNIGQIVITFVNGEFRSATYPFVGHYTYSQWEVMGAISDEINRLKETYKK